VLLDFAKFYTSFVDNSSDISPANVAICTNPATAAAPDPSFDKAFSLGCNRITIEFRSGVPRLKTYTSNLAVTLAAGPGTPHAGIAYPVTLAISNVDSGLNTNSDAASNVRATIQLPTGATLTTTSSDATCAQVPSATIATCTVSALAADASVEIPLLISSNQSGRHDLQVSVDADQHEWNATNNSATASVTVADHADLSLTACTRPASVVQGNPVTVACTVTNNGPQAAANVVLEATLPASLAFTSGTGCTVTGAVVGCTLASLASGTTQSFTMTFSTPTAGAATLPVTVRSATFDFPQTNNAIDGSLVVSTVVPPPPPQPQPPAKSGGGRLSLAELVSLLLGLTVVSYRRIVLARTPRPREARPLP
jgi:uncharacterized repeat protein (TIGR01451 family)